MASIATAATKAEIDTQITAVSAAITAATA